MVGLMHARLVLHACINIFITVLCNDLSNPENGNVTCPSDISVYEDTCNYTCHHGYELKGNSQTRCRSDGTWSSEPVNCTILKCSDPVTEIANSQLIGTCNMTYGSSCSLGCLKGFNNSGNSELVCDDVSGERTSVKWRSTIGNFTCVIASMYIRKILIVSNRTFSNDGLKLQLSKCTVLEIWSPCICLWYEICDAYVILMVNTKPNIQYYP